jgi:outer membrane lipoprotein SlyB
MQKLLIAAVALVLPLAVAAPPNAEAKGCLKGAAVGGLAGHAVGHGIAGAAGGCLIGHHMANKKAKEESQTTARNQAYSGSDTRTREDGSGTSSH